MDAGSGVGSPRWRATRSSVHPLDEAQSAIAAGPSKGTCWRRTIRRPEPTA